MSGPPRSDAQVQAFADAYNAGASAVEAAASIGQQSGSGSRLKADAIARGMIDPGARDWKPVKRTTACNADGDVTGTFLQEKPDTGAVLVDLTGFTPTRITVHEVGGELNQAWKQYKPDAAARSAMIEAAIGARCEAVRPHPPVMLTAKPSADLLNLVTITDAHVGAMAWHKEGGADWDLTIAREVLTRCFTGLIRRMPPAATCIINQLGDFLHTDGLSPITPAHGHVLDADSRYQKMSEVGVDILEDIILVALESHDRVHIIMAEGNHDESGSGWLRIMFKRLFRDNPRVTVDDSPLPYYIHRHGQVMLGFHHGHKLKPEALPQFFAAQFPRLWGVTDKRYCHSGHQHHLHEKDSGGMRFLQHPTLAARDSYAARGGWISPREAIGITYNLASEDSRVTITPDMFAPMAAAA